ncbi:hypothetical protein HY311_03155 [Candidatus Nomurabacteria bacterium]|nr:hypothetical protein [Candidatus Nomurabacteria bacterium]
MKKIINISTKEEVKFTKGDLPMMVHGKEHSGASLLSIVIASMLHVGDKKLLMFTAYPMAKEEFLKQIENPETVFYLESENDFEKATKFQTIFVKSGDADLFTKAISNSSLVKDRIIFVKNIETINIPIFNFVSKYPFIITGDLELNPLQKYFVDCDYSTRILFNTVGNEKIVYLEKYQAILKNRLGEKIITLN